MWVVEDGLGFFKPDAVSTPVASIFLFVPLEPKYSSIVISCFPPEVAAQRPSSPIAPS
jgi:hypothetical protein